jgi:hypothetical protein
LGRCVLPNHQRIRNSSNDEFKSTLLSKMTHTKSEAAAYEFTTLTVYHSSSTLGQNTDAFYHRLSQEC